MQTLQDQQAHYKAVRARLDAAAYNPDRLAASRLRAEVDALKARVDFETGRATRLAVDLARTRESERKLRGRLRTTAVRSLIYDADAIAVVSGLTGFSPAEIVSVRRHLPLVKARHTAIWLCHRFGKASLPMIGRSFGGMDHTTILHAIRKVETAVQVLGLKPDVDDLEGWGRVLLSAEWPKRVSK